MNTEDLIKQFIKIEHFSEGVQVSVCQIRWNNPHTPISEWKVVKKLPKDALESDLDKNVQKTLDNPAFFGVCSKCHSRKPEGWMFSKNLCQQCASKNYGVVY